MDQPQQALLDYEHAIKTMEERDDYWDNRVEHQDGQPLSAKEVVNLRYDKSWLASSYMQFARFLLSRDQSQRAEKLASEAWQIYREIDKEHSALESQSLVALSRRMSKDEPASG